MTTRQEYYQNWLYASERHVLAYYFSKQKSNSQINNNKLKTIYEKSKEIFEKNFIIEKIKGKKITEKDKADVLNMFNILQEEYQASVKREPLLIKKAYNAIDEVFIKRKLKYSDIKQKRIDVFKELEQFQVVVNEMTKYLEDNFGKTRSNGTFIYTYDEMKTSRTKIENIQKELDIMFKESKKLPNLKNLSQIKSRVSGFFSEHESRIGDIFLDMAQSLKDKGFTKFRGMATGTELKEITTSKGSTMQVYQKADNIYEIEFKEKLKVSFKETAKSSQFLNLGDTVEFGQGVQNIFDNMQAVDRARFIILSHYMNIMQGDKQGTSLNVSNYVREISHNIAYESAFSTIGLDEGIVFLRTANGFIPIYNIFDSIIKKEAELYVGNTKGKFWIYNFTNSKIDRTQYGKLETKGTTNSIRYKNYLNYVLNKKASNLKLFFEKKKNNFNFYGL
ncbi:MAG: hypothetical protein EBR82_45550 [Caulobacteraceae bacterium]|nr:hypothetical protein [Caulobacteraceae bacterium]